MASREMVSTKHDACRKQTGLKMSVLFVCLEVPI